MPSSPADLVQRVEDGIVEVSAGRSGGTGFIFETEGTTAFVITAHHLVDDGDGGIEDRVEVEVKNSRTYRATMLGYDSDKDVAVMSICCSDNFTALPWAANRPQEGAQVVSVGYPSSASSQVIATVGEVEDDFAGDLLGMIAHTSPLNPGSSGSPLFSMSGKVWGVNVASSKVSEGIFYAVPYWTIEELVPEWKASLVIVPEPAATPTPTPAPASAKTVSGQADGNGFVTLEEGRYIVTAEVRSNRNSLFIVRVESILSDDVDQEYWSTTEGSYTFLLDVGGSDVPSRDRDLLVGQQLVTVEAQGSWVITFQRVSQ